MREDLRSAYTARFPLLEELAIRLQREVKSALEGVRHVDRISFRVKTVESFVDKATDPRTRPPYGDPLVEIEDQVAGRVVVFFLQDVELVAERIRRNFSVVELTHKRPSKDEEFGYESHHLICLIPPHVTPAEWGRHDRLPATFEMQVRTLFMHAWAEPQHDLAYKGPADLPATARRELFWVAASAWGADQALDRILEWERSRTSRPDGE